MHTSLHHRARVQGRKQTHASLSGTNLQRAGDHNQRVTLQAIRVRGVVTRSELVELTGLTPQAIANISKRLLDEKLVIEVGRVQGGRGQPPRSASKRLPRSSVVRSSRYGPTI